MAAATMNAEASGKKAKIRGRLPSKRSINMATVGQKKTRISTAILALILIIVAAAAIAKFAVMDRLDAVSREQQKVRDLRNQLSAANARLDSFGELQEKYAHYTLADLSSSELNRVERSDVVDLIERVVLPEAELNSWTVKQNQLTLDVTVDTLQDTNILAQLLNEDDMVDFAAVQKAVTNAIKKEKSEAAVEGENTGEAAEGEATEAPAEEAPAEEAPAGETPAEGEQGEDEEKELEYNVTAQIIAYLKVVEEG